MRDDDDRFVELAVQPLQKVQHFFRTLGIQLSSRLENRLGVPNALTMCVKSALECTTMKVP